MDEHLVFLPQASARAVEEACANSRFTHVHILAHGVDFKDNYDLRFGLALHDADDVNAKADIVSGARLATILRPSRNGITADLSKPTVVTLATCHGSDVGSVAGAGSSIAHALHEAGIPMVVAGQFPLSFEGSVRLTEVLYQGLLWGKDPRLLLDDLRRRLHSELPLKHDWACLTAYASLPATFDRQLSAIQIDQVMLSIEVAMNLADRATRSFSGRLTSQQTGMEEKQQLLDQGFVQQI